MTRGRRPGRGGGWRGHPAELGSPGSVRRKRGCAGRPGRSGGRDSASARTRPASDCAAPARPAWPQVPWMRPPRVPRPPSVPRGRPAPASGSLSLPGSPRPAQSSSGGRLRTSARRHGPWAGMERPGRGRQAGALSPCARDRA